jgi:MFS family permease
VSGLGSAVAPIIGGLLAVISYDLLFAVSTLVSVLALILLLFTVREPRRVQSLFSLDTPTQSLAEMGPERGAAE